MAEGQSKPRRRSEAEKNVEVRKEAKKAVAKAQQKKRERFGERLDTKGQRSVYMLWCWVTVLSVLALACLLIWCLLWCVFLLDAFAIIYRSLFDEVAIHCLAGYV